MQTYKQYKESGIDWIGQIPEHWEVKPGFTVLKERKEKNKGMISSNVLSLSYGKIIEKPIEKLTGLVPENFETYQLVYKGDIIFRPTDLQNDKVSLRTGLSKYNGIITSAYINLQPVNSVPRYLHYFLHTTDTNKVIYGLGSGLRQNISFLDFKRFGFIVPPIHEQEAIANFLDEKTAKIDALVQTKEQQIEKLKELRQAKIHQVVTKGLPCHAEPVEASSKTHALSEVEMKDSGVEWIGEIPAHWEVKRLKNIGNAIIGLTYSPNDLCDSNQGTLVLRSSNLQNNDIEYNDNVYVKTGIPEKLKLLLDDIVICSRNGSRELIGKCGIVKNEDLGNTFGAFTTVFRSNINKFLFQILSSGIFKSYSGMFLTSTINQLTISNLNSFKVPIPPIHEQEQIVAYLDEVTGKIDQAITQKQEQITQLKEYKQSLINNVVTGKVKVC